MVFWVEAKPTCWLGSGATLLGSVATFSLGQVQAQGAAHSECLTNAAPMLTMKAPRPTNSTSTARLRDLHMAAQSVASAHNQVGGRPNQQPNEQPTRMPPAPNPRRSRAH